MHDTHLVKQTYPKPYVDLHLLLLELPSHPILHNDVGRILHTANQKYTEPTNQS